MSEIPDAHNVLLELVGSQIHTITGRPNTVLEVGDTEVLVATARSPDGTRVPIEWVQDALRRLVTDGEVDLPPLCPSG